MADSPAPTAARTGRPARPVNRAQVVRVEELTPSLLRVFLTGPGLANFTAGAFTDHYVKLLLPPRGAAYGPGDDVSQIRESYPQSQWPRTRTYTVRSWNADTRELAIDVVQHGDAGLAGPWARNARPGDTIQFMGPGGAYTPDPAADWHLLVGDTAVLPAIAASLERIPAGTPVHVIAQVDGPADEIPLESPGDLTVTWLHHHAGGPDAAAENPADEPLAAAVRDHDFPEGRVHAFVHGEAVAVRELRRHLLADRGLTRDQLSISGYWKRTLDEDGWQSSKREWNAEVEADVPA
ncbi:MAG: siderophore-interacting protein [Patulibacter sp.]|nr:siderophore-interacting protein [Patulibacter sp.]